MGQKLRLSLVILGSLGLQLGCDATANTNQSSVKSASAKVIAANGLSVATWNVEHLAYPIDKGCKPRSADELVALQAYARNIDADIVGLQEVGSKEAVALLFPESDWQIVMSARPDSEAFECRGSGNISTQQKVAFAIRKSLPIVATDSLDEFGLQRRGLRYGLEVKLETALGKVSVLNVHMKSGCFVDNYSRSDSDACRTFAKQAPLLEQWVDEQEASSQPYIVIGDFNHRLTAPYNHLTQQLYLDDNKVRTSIINSNADMIGCHPYYPAPIDHVFVGNLPSSAYQFTSKSLHFKDMAVDAMLSDHCAIRSAIRLNNANN